MALDRDDLAARATAARAALLSLCEALSALVPVAPASGAPATEPRRTVGAVVRDVQRREFIVARPGYEGYVQRRLDSGAGSDVNIYAADHDEFVRWATREECERHGIPYVARPLPGAPLAAPSRPEWVRITGPDGAEDVTIGRAYRVLGWTDVRGGRPSITNDAGVEWVCAGPNEDGHDTLPTWEPCAAPSPAATPAGYVPSVGDVVKHVSESDAVATTGQIRVVVSTNPIRWVYVENGVRGGERGPTGWGNDVRFVRPATSSERAAAGLPVDESACHGECDTPPPGRCSTGCAPDERPAFDEAKEREAARLGWRNDPDMGIDDEEAYLAGWLARARVAARGGAS